MAIAKSPALPSLATTKGGGGSLATQVRDHLRTRILTHEWNEGKKIPSEFDLAGQYQVSRVTIRTALNFFLQMEIDRSEVRKTTAPDKPAG